MLAFQITYKGLRYLGIKQLTHRKLSDKDKPCFGNALLCHAFGAPHGVVSASIPGHAADALPLLLHTPPQFIGFVEMPLLFTS